MRRRRRNHRAAILRRRVPPVDLTFITTWQTTTAAESITLPLISTGTYDFEVDWGDGSTDVITAFDDPARIHEYAEAGVRDVRISGVCAGWTFDDVPASRDAILDVKNWGILAIIDGAFRSFNACSNLNVTAADAPDLSGSTNLVETFRDCLALSGSSGFSKWDVSAITQMTRMFRSTSFDADISGWDVSNVSFFIGMFEGGEFTQDISGWDTSSATRLEQMFQNNVGFDHDLGGWDVSNVTDATNMFFNTTLSTANYDALLVGWATQTVQPNVNFHGGNSTYSAGAAADARAVLTSEPNNWTITDGGLAV